MDKYSVIYKDHHKEVISAKYCIMRDDGSAVFANDRPKVNFFTGKAVAIGKLVKVIASGSWQEITKVE